MQTIDEKKKEARRAYKREWNRRNRDRVKAAQARYMEKRIQTAARELLLRAAETTSAGANND